MNRIEQKDSISLVAIDSGLGGLAVAASLYERLRRNCPFQRVRVILFNCRPSNVLGFDAMATNEQRSRVFSRVLDCAADASRPYLAGDAILIACNSLSVLYQDTDFSRSAPIPVREIVKPGVKLIQQYIEQRPDATVLLFGSITTIEKDVHRRALTAAGVDRAHVIPIACSELIRTIERKGEGPETEAMVARFVEQGLARRLHTSSPVAAALLCTHFGYVEHLFRKASFRAGVEFDALLDPTPGMAEAFVRTLPQRRREGAELSIECVSQAPVDRAQMEQVGGLVRRISPDAAEALRRNLCIKGLFAID